MRLLHAPRRRLKVGIFSPDTPCIELPAELVDGDIDSLAIESPQLHAPGLDSLLVDLRALRGDEGRLRNVIQRVRREAVGHSLIFLIDLSQWALAPVKRLARLSPVIASCQGQRGLIGHIKRAAVSRDCADEASIRLRSLALLQVGQICEIPERSLSTTVVIGAPSPAMLETLSSYGVHGKIVGVLKAHQALQALETRQADRLLILASKNRRPQAGIVRLLRRHSELHGTPIVTIEARSSDRHEQYWATAGADAVFSINQMDLAATTLDRLARAHRTGENWRLMLKHLSLNDYGEVSQIASGRFFETVLSQRTTAQETGPLCLGAIRLDPAEGTDHQAALVEAAVYLSLATRPEDLMTRPSPDVFLMYFPNTDKHHARQTLHAIINMVRDLKFGPTDASCTFSPVSHLIESHRGGTVQARVRQLLSELPRRRHPTASDVLA